MSVLNIRDEAMTSLAAILHTLICEKEHAKRIEDILEERSPDICYFYIEESLADNQIDHQYWYEQAEEICKKYELQPLEILRILPPLLEVRQKLESIISKAPTALELCRQIVLCELL